jgi:predicted MFS family arabinose efflux permease
LPAQGALIALSLFAAWAVDHDRPLLLVSILLLNLAASIQDVAADGMAVDLLEPHELALGNTIQVVGAKLGMVLTGGLLLMWEQQLGWRGVLLVQAALLAGAFVVVAVFREPAAAARAPRRRARHVAGALWDALRAPSARWLILIAFTYKAGESMADQMFKPHLLDLGYSKADIGLWVNTWGMLFSIAGSVAGGALAHRLGLWRALWVTAALRVGPQALMLWFVVRGFTPWGVIISTGAEHFFGGALTTALFAVLMANANRALAATHYTALASFEVAGKAAAAAISGHFAQALGMTALFGAALGLSSAYLVVLWAAIPRVAGRR